MKCNHKTGLIVIDVQGKLAEVMYKKNKLIKNLEKMILGAKLMDIPIIWTEQVPHKIGPTIKPIKTLLTEYQPIIKKEFSCVQNPEFKNKIMEMNIKHFLLCGIETHVCVYQTAMDLLEMDFHVDVIVDAVSSRSKLNKEIGLDRILLAGGSQTTVETFLFEQQGVAEGTRFRNLINLIKD